MKEFTLKQKKEAHRQLNNNISALEEYKKEIKHILKTNISRYCQEAIRTSQLLPSIHNDYFQQKSIIDLQKMREYQLKKDIDRFSENIAEEIKTVIELAIGRWEDPEETIEKLNRFQILDLRKE